MSPRVRHHYRAHKVAFWTRLIPQLAKAGDGPVNAEHHLLTDFSKPATFEGRVRDIDFSVFPPTPAPPPTVPPSRLSTPRRGQMENQPLATPPSHRVTRRPPRDNATATVGNTPVKEKDTEIENTYSTALSIVIAVGCSFLILNVLILAGVYYNRDKKRIEAKMNKKEYELNRAREDEVASLQGTPQHKNSNSTHRALQYGIPPAPPPPSQRIPYTHEATV